MPSRSSLVPFDQYSCPVLADVQSICRCLFMIRGHRPSASAFRACPSLRLGCIPLQYQHSELCRFPQTVLTPSPTGGRLIQRKIRASTAAVICDHYSFRLSDLSFHLPRVADIAVSRCSPAWVNVHPWNLGEMPDLT
jgi:hypothetical protein